MQTSALLEARLAGSSLSQRPVGLQMPAGCALQAAILSPLYKVQDFKVEDSFCVNGLLCAGLFSTEGSAEHHLFSSDI